MSGIFGNKSWMAKLERSGGGSRRKPLASRPSRARSIKDLKQAPERSKPAKHLGHDKGKANVSTDSKVS